MEKLPEDLQLSGQASVAVSGVIGGGGSVGLERIVRRFIPREDGDKAFQKLDPTPRTTDDFAAGCIQ